LVQKYYFKHVAGLHNKMHTAATCHWQSFLRYRDENTTLDHPRGLGRV